jgi:DNA-binding transcriptional LysR family regulator
MDEEAQIVAPCARTDRASTAVRLPAIQTSNIELRSIWHSIVAAEELSFHRAAVVLGLDQSVVSRRIRALEDQLGVSLFERSHAGVRLTKAGKDFVREARSALRDLDYAVKAARSAGIGYRGSLRIGFFCSLATGFLRELLIEFARAHKTVAIDLDHGATGCHIQEIRDRTMDIAFFTGCPTLADCDVELLWHERVFCVLPIGHRLASKESLDWSDVRAESFIVSQEEPGPEIHDYLVKHLATLGFHPNVKRLSVCRESLIHLVAMGFGLTLTSESAVSSPFQGVTFRPINGVDAVLPCVGVWSPSNDNPALRRFVSLARVLKRRRASNA